MSIKSTIRPIRTAIVGLGRAGWLIHLADLKGDSRFQIVGAADPDPERCREMEKAHQCPTFSSLLEMLQAVDTELVIVATPTMHHYPDAVRVLESGCHCVLEKPMAAEHEDSLRLVEQARCSSGKLFIHHQQVFRPEYLHLREVVSSNVLGDIFHLEVYWSRYSRRWDWQTLMKNGGGQLNNHGSHALSMLLPLLDGKVTDVTADLRNIKDAGDAEDHAFLFLKTEGRMTASITVTSVSALPMSRWRILGSRGTLECDGTTSRLRYYHAGEVASLEAIDTAAPGRAYQGEHIPWLEEVRNVADTPGAGGFYDNVYHVLRDNGKMRVTMDDALEVMRVIELARNDSKFSASHLP